MQYFYNPHILRAATNKASYCSTCIKYLHQPYNTYVYILSTHIHNIKIYYVYARKQACLFLHILYIHTSIYVYSVQCTYTLEACEHILQVQRPFVQRSRYIPFRFLGFFFCSSSNIVQSSEYINHMLHFILNHIWSLAAQRTQTHTLIYSETIFGAVCSESWMGVKYSVAAVRTHHMYTTYIHEIYGVSHDLHIWKHIHSSKLFVPSVSLHYARGAFAVYAYIVGTIYHRQK